MGSNSKMRRGGKNSFIFEWIMVALLLAELAVLCVYGSRKAGFHEDELYTYYSSNKTAGLFINDRQWMEQDQLRDDFVVLPGERFRYSIVKQMQSWDVHPPLYYYLFHTACSLFPGVFSKWFGIGVNLPAFILSYILLAWICHTAATMGDETEEIEGGVLMGTPKKKKDRQGWYLAFLTCLAWGFGSAVISGVMFIRMYEWLTFFILLCLALHLYTMKREAYCSVKFLLPLALTVFCGFLTQYYYIIFHFFLGAGFVLWLLRQKKFQAVLYYGAACAVGLCGAILYYPASLSHIFRGYRGTEAVSEFTDASNTLGRLRFFTGLFDDYVMGDSLMWWLLLLCLLGVTVYFLKKRGKLQDKMANPAIGLMLFAAAGYFLTVSKTALLLGETSNRYQLPIYGILLFLLFWGVWMSGRCLLTYFGRNKTKTAGGSDKGVTAKKADSERIGHFVLAGVLLLAVLLMDGRMLAEGKVFFLYEEEAPVMEYVKENRELPVVVFYNEASGDNIWWLSDELMEFPRVYLASQGNESPITDEALVNCKGLLAYVADYENKESCLQRLVEENSNLSGYRVAAEKGLWTLYECR